MSKKKKKEKIKAIPLTMFTFEPPPPEVHPNETQEDPINGKFEKSIELLDYGIRWT